MESWQWLDRARAAEAAAWLRSCCGATRWVERMLARRPFGSADTLQRAAGQEWFSLTREDWLEAIGHHPRLGDRDALRARFSGAALSAAEQSSVTAAPDAVLDELADANRRYESRFGFIFIACATGQSADMILGLLKARLHNDPDTELRIAAEEIAKINALRLARAVT
jgi:2-oxo-4-hydroxy-4-carboxy-5-ureidoimidazoline decarboxylase